MLLSAILWDYCIFDTLWSCLFNQIKVKPVKGWNNGGHWPSVWRESSMAYLLPHLVHLLEQVVEVHYGQGVPHGRERALEAVALSLLSTRENNHHQCGHPHRSVHHHRLCHQHSHHCHHHTYTLLENYNVATQQWTTINGLLINSS